MTARLRLTRGVAAFGVAALALSACGGGGETTPAASDGSPTEESSAPVAQGDGVLNVGSLLPQTGNLAILGPPTFAGVQLAVNEINEAGGVLGQPVGYEVGDSGDTQQDVANPTVDRLLAAGVDAIIGAASSGVSFTVIDKITGAGVVHYSPANTSPDFTDYEDNGLYFRTAPSDVLQGRILGETILADGNTTVGILALQDPYGEGLADNVGTTITENGGTLAPEAPVFYDPAASNFDAQVGQVAAADPDAIVLIGFNESTRVIQSMIAAGIGPQDKQLYLVDGNMTQSLGNELPAGVLEGTKGSFPGAETPGDFRERLLGVNPALVDFTYSAEAYDAVVTTALAAVAAGNDAGEAIAAELPAVTREGTPCGSFQECADLLEAGEDIDYDGVSGPIEFSEAGDPTEASVGIYTFGPDNKYGNPVYASGSLED